MVFMLLAGIILSLGVLTYLIDRKVSAVLLSLERDRSALLADDIAREISYAMLIDKKPAVLKYLVTSHTVPNNDINTALFRADGSLYAGETSFNAPAEILSNPRNMSVESNGRLIFLRPLLNEKACKKCHRQDMKMLGIVMVDTSTDKIHAVISEIRLSMLIFMVLVAALGSIGIILTTKRMVLSPLAALREAADKIGAGELQHRVYIDSKDEFGLLAITFNHMAESMETSVTTLDKAVQQRTLELEVIARLSEEVFRGNRNFADSVHLFLETITSKLGFGYAYLCLVDKDTGLLSREFREGHSGAICTSDISLAGAHPLSRAILEAKPALMKALDIGGAADAYPYVMVIPLISHQRKKCHEVSPCFRNTCPAFGNVDERCWLISGTLCRSPQSIEGKGKLYGCIHCPAFPVYGVLLAGIEHVDGYTTSRLNSLEILASEISSALENHRLIDQQKDDIMRLIKLHDLSVQKMTVLDMPSLLKFIVSSIAPLVDIHAAILWLKKGNALHFSNFYGIGVLSEIDHESLHAEGMIPASILIDESLVGRSVTEMRPVESIGLESLGGLGNFVEKYGIRYIVSIPLKFREAVEGCITLFRRSDIYMTDSEKALVALFTNQASAAIQTVRLYQELRLSKDFSEAIFNSTAGGILVIDSEGHILKINRSGAGILKKDAADIVGRKISALYPEMEIFHLPVKSLTREISITLADNSLVPIGFTCSLLPRGYSQNECIVVMFRDLTEIKKLQAELKKKDHFETMGKVVAGVAHEVRNPLFGISSIGQILQRESDNPQHLALVAAMLRECERMKNLVEELLLYTRPAHLDIGDINLGIFFLELQHYVKDKRAGISISLEIPPLLTIRADRDKITQVMLNVLINAVEAARSCVTVAARQTDDLTEIRISDDGPGISQKHMEQIFEPFFTTKKGGTGLGLPICKKLIEDHGGTIDIVSPDDRGTEVVLRLRS